MLSLVLVGERIISAQSLLTAFDHVARGLGRFLLEHLNNDDRIRVDTVDDTPGAGDVIDPQLMALGPIEGIGREWGA
jgi:hypothetical protein